MLCWRVERAPVLRARQSLPTGYDEEMLDDFRPVRSNHEETSVPDIGLSLATTYYDHVADLLRGKGSLPKTLRIEIQQPSTEPMLWIPDQLLGALGEHRSAHGQSRWYERYDSIELIPISV